MKFVEPSSKAALRSNLPPEEVTWHSRVLWILSQVADVEPERREEAVRRLARDEQTFDEVIRLLGDDDLNDDDPADVASSPDDSWLGQPVVESDATGYSRPGGLATQKKTPAGYKLDRLLGRGAMGEVWKAEQREPVERPVALKRLARVDVPEAWLARFDQERQTLARLEHPSIARIYDAGQCPDGVPFLAMELVDGEPLTKYAHSRSLDGIARIRLMIDVCEAVSHAHRRGVLHRDLKPANILAQDAEREGGRPVVKVIDFGIAKSVAGAADTDRTDDLHPHLDLDATSTGSSTSSSFGTPAYMAPEQFNEHGIADTRSDVWSLGIVLYELLSGTRPFGPAWSSEEAVAPLGSGDDAREMPRLSRRLRGDLDQICAAALAASPEDRYASVEALAEDLRRSLDGRPLRAGPDKLVYRTNRWLLRHRATAAGLAMAATLIFSGTGATAWQAVRATQAEQDALDNLQVAQDQRDEADRLRRDAEDARGRAEQAQLDAEHAKAEAERSQKIAESSQRFLIGTLEAASLYSDLGHNLTVADMVAQASEEIAASEHDMDPLLAASIHASLGQVYMSMSDRQPAHHHLLRAYDLLEQHLGPDKRETLIVGTQVAKLLRLRGQPEAAKTFVEQLLPRMETYEDQTGDKGVRLLTLDVIGSMPQRTTSATDRDRARFAALELAREMYADDPSLIYYLGSAGDLYRFKDEQAKALSFYNEAIELADKFVAEGRMPESSPRRLSAIVNKALTLRGGNRSNEAIELLDDVIPQIERVWPRGSRWPQLVRRMRGSALLDVGRLDEAFAGIWEDLENIRSGTNPRWEWARESANIATDLIIYARPEEALRAVEEGRRAVEAGELEQTGYPLVIDMLQAAAEIELGREPAGGQPHLETLSNPEGKTAGLPLYPRTKLVIGVAKAKAHLAAGQRGAAIETLRQVEHLRNRRVTRELPVAQRFDEVAKELDIEFSAN